ncbi:unnamed protein product, partial [Bemisia tabaci]
MGSDSSRNYSGVLRHTGSEDLMTSGGKFVCKICKGVYKHSHNLKAHMRSHTGETFCPVCNKT